MPKLNPDDCHVSASVRRLNPDLFRVGRLDPPIHREPPRALVSREPTQPRRSRRLPKGADVTVTLCAYLWRRLDPDNLGHALKPVQDATASWLGIDDGDPRCRWEYGQVETRGAQGVAVKIETAHS